MMNNITSSREPQMRWQVPCAKRILISHSAKKRKESFHIDVCAFCGSFFSFLCFFRVVFSQEVKGIAFCCANSISILCAYRLFATLLSVGLAPDRKPCLSTTQIVSEGDR